MTFAQDIERVAGDERILSAVIGEMGWSGYGEEGRLIPAYLKGQPLPWEVARPLLDYDYDSNYGAPDCHAVAAYTTLSIIMVSQYDGSTSLFSAPRNPGEFMPEMPGG